MFCLQYLTVSQLNAQGKITDEVTIKFKDVPIKMALSSLAQSLKLTLEFDSSVKNTSFSIELYDITERKAFEIILTNTKLKAGVKDDNQLLIYADTAENRDKYSKLKEWKADRP